MQPPFLSYFWTSDSKLCLEPQVSLSLLPLFYLCSSRPFSALLEVCLTWFSFAPSCIYLFPQQAWDVPPPHKILDSCKIIRILKVSAPDARELLNRRLTNDGRDCKQTAQQEEEMGKGRFGEALSRQWLTLPAKYWRAIVKTKEWKDVKGRENVDEFNLVQIAPTMILDMSQNYRQYVWNWMRKSDTEPTGKGE